ncbi:MAG: hypothetical protein E7057_01355 [Lentisphaerae bacterium]|nr:hypothetical protein [Lentisphaerota bacterium]
MNSILYRKFSWCVLAFLFLVIGSLAGAEEKITVRKMGDKFVVRSEFSPSHDLVILNFDYANEAAYLLPKNVPLKDFRKGRQIHSNRDEYPPSSFTGWGFLGGNHGSPFGRTLLVPNHGLTTADIGGKITEKDGYTYIIIRIPDKDNILIHPLGSGDDHTPRMRYHSKAPLFYRNKPLAFQESVSTAIYNLNRVTDYRLLADGKRPVPENTDVVCDYVDLVFVHDLISPNALVRSVMNNPGKKPSPEWSTRRGDMGMVNTPELRKKYPEYMKIAAMATFHNLYRFEARGASVLYRKTVYHSRLAGVKSMDVMYGWFGEIARKKKQYFYIPKMKPLKLRGRTKADPILACDFSGNYLMPEKMNLSTVFSRQDALDPEDLPDRFIRITGDRTPEFGIALGYSLLNGCTAKSRKGAERESYYYFWYTKKMYPYSYILNEIKPGKTMETIAYKQYFNPRLEPDATSLYWHREGDSMLVYMDFHKELKNKLIRLPKKFTGKKISIVEKTPSLVLHSQSVVPAEGILLDVNGKHGYLVLKLD